VAKLRGYFGPFYNDFSGESVMFQSFWTKADEPFFTTGSQESKLQRCTVNRIYLSGPGETQRGAGRLPICVTLLLQGEIRKRCRLRAPQQRCYFKL